MSTNYVNLIIELENFSKKLDNILFKLNLLKNGFNFDYFLENKKCSNKNLNQVQLVNLYHVQVFRTTNILVNLLAFSFNKKNASDYILPITSKTKNFILENREVLTKEQLQILKNVLSKIEMNFLKFQEVFSKYEASLFLARLKIKQINGGEFNLKIKTPLFLIDSDFFEHGKKKIHVSSILTICKQEFYSASIVFNNYQETIKFLRLFSNQ